MLLCAYSTYLACEVVDQSGIVGALICGFAMKKCAKPSTVRGGVGRG